MISGWQNYSEFRFSDNDASQVWSCWKLDFVIADMYFSQPQILNPVFLAFLRKESRSFISFFVADVNHGHIIPLNTLWRIGACLLQTDRNNSFHFDQAEFTSLSLYTSSQEHFSKSSMKVIWSYFEKFLHSMERGGSLPALIFLTTTSISWSLNLDGITLAGVTFLGLLVAKKSSRVELSLVIRNRKDPMREIQWFPNLGHYLLKMISKLYTIISNKLWDLSLYVGDLYNRELQS